MLEILSALTLACIIFVIIKCIGIFLDWIDVDISDDMF